MKLTFCWTACTYCFAGMVQVISKFSVIHASCREFVHPSCESCLEFMLQLYPVAVLMSFRMYVVTHTVRSALFNNNISFEVAIRPSEIYNCLNWLGWTYHRRGFVLFCFIIQVIFYECCSKIMFDNLLLFGYCFKVYYYSASSC